jgi:hypothetical protein
MKNTDIAIPKATTDKLFSFWIDCINRRETVNCIFVPLSDRYYRVSQFIQDYGVTFQNTSFTQLSTQSLNIEAHDFIRVVNSLRSPETNHQVFIIMDGEWTLYHQPQMFEQIKLLTYTPTPQDTFIITYETNPHLPELESISLANQVLSKNIQLVPLYSASDISQFIDYFSKLIEVKVNPTQRKEIMDMCGGYIVFVSEALRTLKQLGKVQFDTDNFLFKLRSVWNNFSPSQQQVLSAITTKSSYTPALNHLIQSFLQQKLLTINKAKLEVSCPLLKQYIRSISRKTLSFSDTGLSIQINHVPVDHLFTDRECELLKTLTHSPTSISREKAAEILWDNNTDYSDWALDQVIKRLRQKLSQLGIHPKAIRTIKSQGYLWDKTYG